MKALLWEGDGFLLLYKRLKVEYFSGQELKKKLGKLLSSNIDGQLVISDIELGLFNEAEKEMDSSVLEPVPFEEPIKRTRKGYKRKNLFKDPHSQDQVFKLEASQPEISVVNISGNI